MINRESGSLEQNSHEERNLLETPDSATGKDFPGFLCRGVCVFLRLILALFVYLSHAAYLWESIYTFVFSLLTFSTY